MKSLKKFLGSPTVLLQIVSTVALMLLMTFTALAQDGGDGGGAPQSNPLDLLRQLSVVVIPVLTPVVVSLVKSLAKNIPANWLPILAPIVGMLLAALGSAFGVDLTGGAGAIVGGGALGAAGVGVREAVNQNINSKKKAS